MQHLYSEKYKILLKEMKKNLSKWKDIPYLLVEDIKIAILSTDRFNIIPIKNPVSIFAEIDKLILKFI